MPTKTSNGRKTEDLEDLVHEPWADPLTEAPFNDIENSERLTSLNQGRLAWVPEKQEWAFYTGTVWDFSNPDQVIERAKETVRETQAAVAQLPTSVSNRQQKVEEAAKMGSRRSIDNMIYLSRPDLSISDSQFDRNPMLFNVANGTLDLENGLLRDHDSRDLLTMQSPVSYILGAESEDWKLFLDLLTKGDPALKKHLQRVAGYCLTGLAYEGSLFFLLGPTRTGKTTYANALSAIWGGYAWKAQFDTFLTGRRTGAVRDDIAAMEGKRLVIASEVSSGQRLDEAVVKELTGEDTINARQLYQQSRNFKPVLKLMLAANDFPHVRSDDSGTWARLNLIRVENEELQDRKHLELKQRVMNPKLTGPAILAWAVEGCLDWQREGHLAVPESVKEAVQEQREEFKPLKSFIEDCCRVEEGHETSNQALRSAYVEWCKRMGEKNPIGTKRFSQELTALGFQQRKSGDRKWVGIHFNSSYEDKTSG